MSAPATMLLRLALRLAERGDADGAAEALRGLIAMPNAAQASPTDHGGELRAVSRTRLAAMLGCTPEHVSALVRRGRIPPEAVLGEGRGMRIVVDAALAALRRGTTPRTVGAALDPLESEGEAYAARRGAMRVMKGGSK